MQVHGLLDSEVQKTLLKGIGSSVVGEQLREKDGRVKMQFFAQETSFPRVGGPK